MGASTQLVKALTSVDQQQFYNARQSIVALGRAAVPGLIEALSNTTTDRDRWRMLLTLAQIGGPEVVVVMIGQLRSSSSAIRAVAAQFLGQSGDMRALEPMLELLREADPTCSLLWILTALGKLGNPVAIDPIINYLHIARSAPERCAAIEALGDLGDPRALEHVRRYAQDSDHHVRDKVKGVVERLSVQLQ